MKKTVIAVVMALLMSASAAWAATTEKWTAGWDNFSAPLNYTKSNIKWSVNSTTRKLTLTFTLVGAAPTNLYQFSLNFFCTTFPATWGQFPNDTPGGGACTPLTRQGVTADSAEVEVGAVLTDLKGNGKYTIVVGPVPSGTYNLEFFTRNGAGCNVNGGGPNDADHCEADFQSPGPFGTGTTITVP
jgi:hypothetical protein